MHRVPEIAGVDVLHEFLSDEADFLCTLPVVLGLYHGHFARTAKRTGAVTSENNAALL